MNEFFVDRYRVDMLRSQIVDESAVSSVEPKALAVLFLLAKHQGQVVKHYEILDAVWPNVVVEPNALQRSIAQLRKAFGDNAKEQKIIATYPKVGYSLVANVDWEMGLTPDKQLAEQEPHEPIKAERSNSHGIKLGVLAAVLVVIVSLAYWMMNGHDIAQPSSFEFRSATPLTATDETEFYASFSPDGRYLAFSRFNRSCQNQLWAKDLQTQQEFLLTEQLGYYETPAWSPDGKSLAYTKRRDCESDLPERTCMELRSINFSLAKNRPQNSNLLLNCGESSYESVQWIGRDTLAFVAHAAEGSTVQSLSLQNSDEIEVLYKSDNSPYHISFALSTGKLAIIEHDKGEKNHLVVLEPASGKLSRSAIQFPESTQYRRWWWPRWHPNGESLVSANTNYLLEIALDGEVTSHAIASPSDIFHPAFHPSAHQLVATAGNFDSDVMELTWSQGDENNIEALESSDALFRSTVLDWGAQYQPNGTGLAMVSKRTGSHQLWFVDKDWRRGSESIKQFSQLPESGAWVSSAWSLDGRFLAYTANGHLYLHDLSDLVQQVADELYVEQLLQWIDDEQLLLLVIDDMGRKLVRYDLNDGSIHDYEVASKKLKGKSYWAQVDRESGYLYFRGNKDRLYRSQGTEFDPVPELGETPIKGKFFIEQGQLVYADEEDTIFILNFATQESVQLATVDDLQSIDDVDLQAQRLLFSKVVGSYKQLVLFR